MSLSPEHYGIFLSLSIDPVHFQDYMFAVVLEHLQVQLEKTGSSKNKIQNKHNHWSDGFSFSILFYKISLNLCETLSC